MNHLLPFLQVKLLCNDNLVNMRYDDKDAFIYTYDNKFCFEADRLDVYVLLLQQLPTLLWLWLIACCGR